MKQIRETSDFVCEKLISGIKYNTFMRVLEPSCGDGKIIEYLVKRNYLENSAITGIELNEDRFLTAMDILKNYITYDRSIDLVCSDFLSWGKKYFQVEGQFFFDLIIACPPFKNNVDLEHIKLMYDLLKPTHLDLKVRSQLVTLTSPFWILNNELHQVEFREWLKNKNYTFELLPDNSFMEKGKTVPTGILRLSK